MRTVNFVRLYITKAGHFRLPTEWPFVHLPERMKFPRLFQRPAEFLPFPKLRVAAALGSEHDGEYNYNLIYQMYVLQKTARSITIYNENTLTFCIFNILLK